MSGTKLKLLAAMSTNRGIGKNNSLPWNLPNETKFFSNLTKRTKSPFKKNAVIMGRKTWESIPNRHRPLVDRINIVLTKNPQILRKNVPDDVLIADSLDSAIKLAENNNYFESIWIIGGENVFKEAMDHKYCYRIYLTEIQKYYEADTFFPDIGNEFKLLNNHGEESDIPMEKQTENGVDYYFRIYEKK